MALSPSTGSRTRVDPVRRLFGARRGGLAATVVPIGLYASIAVCVLYYLYRYPLQVSGTEASSTYSDTPLSLQLGKYALLGAIAALTTAFSLPAIASWLRRFTVAELALAGFAIFAVARGAIALAHTGDTYVLQRMGPIVAVTPILILAALWLGADAGRGSTLAKRGAIAAAVLVVAHAGANVVEIVLWQAFDRLPALGYTGLFGRFGGLWDDPNSCAAYSAAVLLLLVARVIPLTARWRVLVAVGAIFNLLAAFSYSGWLVLVVGLLAAAVLTARRRLLVSVFGAVGVATALLLVVLPSPADWPVLGPSLAVKNKSAALRLHLDTYFSQPASVAEWLLGSANQPPTAVENWLGALLSATGLIGAALFSTWLFLAGRTILRAGGAHWFVPLTSGALVGSLFVPYLTLFPLGSLFVLTISLAAAGSKVRREPWRRPQLALGGCLAAALLLLGVGFNTERRGFIPGVLGAEAGIEVSYWDVWGEGIDKPVIERTSDPAFVQSGEHALLIRLRNSEAVPRGKYAWVTFQRARRVSEGERYRLRAYVSGRASLSSPIQLGVRFPEGTMSNEDLRPIGNGLTKTNAANRWLMEGEYVVPFGGTSIQLAIWKDIMPAHSRSEIAVDDAVVLRQAGPRAGEGG